jgi:hypothetical protein
VLKDDSVVATDVLEAAFKDMKRTNFDSSFHSDKILLISMSGRQTLIRTSACSKIVGEQLKRKKSSREISRRFDAIRLIEFPDPSPRFCAPHAMFFFLRNKNQAASPQGEKKKAREKKKKAQAEVRI